MATLPATVEERMLQAARAVRARAHAPYSKFHVGAALLDEHGQVHVGCNVENAAYPQGVCAEAGAISALVAAGGRRVEAVVVVGEVPRPHTDAGNGDGDGGGQSTAVPIPSTPVTPCGGCRQKLREFAGALTPIIMADGTTVLLRSTLDELLPHSFGPEHLDRKP
jgi:cytidine deaminase